MNTPNKVHLRDYSKIYTGTNQSGGYETPFLGFRTDTTATTLRSDKSTYFHFPNTTEQIYLSATDLIESGAFAGSMPYRSDKIFKKTANYKNNEPWGNAQPENTQHGVWLCAWLSGNDSNPSQTPVWMDRWYKPGAFNDTFTLFTSSASAIYDTPSQLTFDPGVWYRYDHIGDINNQSIVDTLCSTRIHIDHWTETSLDESGYENNATLVNFTENMVGAGVNPDQKTDDTCLQLNGVDQYASILCSNSYNLSTNITCNVWVNSEDWQNQPSHHFISNGFRGGWSIGYNNGFYTPLAVLTDARGNVIFSNQKGDLYKDIVLPGSPRPVSIGVDSNLYTWILDNGVYQNQKHLYRLDYNGNIESSVSFTTALTLKDLVIDHNDTVWVLTDQLGVSGYNTQGVFTSAKDLEGNKLVITKNHVLTAFDALDATVYNVSSYFTVSANNNVYLNNSLVLSGISATNIQASIDNIWILSNNSNIIKLGEDVNQVTGDITFSIKASATIDSTATTNYSGRNLFFTYDFINGENQEVVWVLQPSTEYIYKYDTDLNLIDKVKTIYVEHFIQDSAIRGDATGYQWHRKFNYSTLPNQLPRVECVAYISTDSVVTSGYRYKLSVPVSGYNEKEWHMYTLKMGDTIQFYEDSILRDQQTIGANSIYYKYETPLVCGTNIGLISPIDIELHDLHKYYHKGCIDDLRIHGTLLNNSDLRHIYYTRYHLEDLVWNMPCGVKSYVEEIVKFFKFKAPGQKSQYYNIHLKGLQITDENVRLIIENIIKDTVKKIAPLYTSLYKIIWD